MGQLADLLPFESMTPPGTQNSELEALWFFVYSLLLGAKTHTHNTTQHNTTQPKECTRKIQEKITLSYQL